jgi:hypothetical protein
VAGVSADGRGLDSLVACLQMAGRRACVAGKVHHKKSRSCPVLPLLPPPPPLRHSGVLLRLMVAAVERRGGGRHVCLGGAVDGVLAGVAGGRGLASLRDGVWAVAALGHGEAVGGQVVHAQRRGLDLRLQTSNN